MARLTIAMNGIEVGHLTLERSGAMTFQYRRDWIAQPGARAISLSLPLSSRPYKGERVYNFFDNLLPDSEAILARMQARFQAPTSHPFDLLASVGRECVGALQLYPEDQTIPDVKTITAEPIHNAAIASLLGSYQGAPLGMEKEHEFRISLAGAQEKTALLWHNNQWQRPHGSTPTTHISWIQTTYRPPGTQQYRPAREQRKRVAVPSASGGLRITGTQCKPGTVRSAYRPDRGAL